ncbi:MAG: hypothetical protein AAF490_19255 [Chloroflexota bacterium]
MAKVKPSLGFNEACRPTMLLIDLCLLFLGWFVAQIVFNEYEAHVPLSKRVFKFCIILIALSAIHYFGSRIAFFSVIALMSIGIGILHGYWFHYRNGIHWRTAHPKEKYFQLIGKE